jgi:hypothetical protein
VIGLDVVSAAIKGQVVGSGMGMVVGKDQATTTKSEERGRETKRIPGYG